MFQYFLAACLEGCLTPDENPNDELSLLTEQLEIALTYSSIAIHTVSLYTQFIHTVSLYTQSIHTVSLYTQ